MYTKTSKRARADFISIAFRRRNSALGLLAISFAAWSASAAAETVLRLYTYPQGAYGQVAGVTLQKLIAKNSKSRFERGITLLSHINKILDLCETHARGFQTFNEIKQFKIAVIEASPSETSSSDTGQKTLAVIVAQRMFGQPSLSRHLTDGISHANSFPCSRASVSPAIFTDVLCGTDTLRLPEPCSPNMHQSAQITDSGPYTTAA